MTILGIVGSVIMITALGIILVTSEQSFMTCSMIYYPGVLVANLDVTMISMISGLRYVLKTQLISYMICFKLQIDFKYFQKFFPDTTCHGRHQKSSLLIQNL